LGDTGFRQMFSGSPIKRIGWPRFLRNVLYAIGNSGTPHLRPYADVHTVHSDPVIQDAARWAVTRLTAM
jgi:epoxyqueuosine reductase